MMPRFMDSFDRYSASALNDQWTTQEPRPGTPVIGVSKEGRLTVARDGRHIGSVPLVMGNWYEDLWALVDEATMWGDEPPEER
jgi:hypothetical protein